MGEMREKALGIVGVVAGAILMLKGTDQQNNLVASIGLVIAFVSIFLVID